MKFKQVQRGKTGGLGHQRAGRTRHRSGQRVGQRESRIDRNTDGHGAQPVVANGHQRSTQRRLRHAPEQHKEKQQHAQGIVGRGLAGQVKLEAAQDGPHHHSLQTIGAAGQPVELVGQLHENQAQAQRDHQAREVAAAQNRQRGHQAQQRGRRNADRQADQRVGHDVFGKQRRRITAQAEEGRVAQRDNAGVTQDDVQRNSEQRHDGDFIDDQGMAGGEHRRRKCQQPKYQLQRFDAALLQQRSLCVQTLHVTCPPCAQTGLAGARSGSRSSGCTQ